ncbi:hypothetical protein CspHIS471_0401620 [Cutaneotrichosporon sp. HIS471]|nr:hypothetical protein CspHIS471_0401620 [Cutaneotrichosporon sp. HIS471]
MKFTTFALFTALAAIATAAPMPEAHRDGQRGGNRHGHKYGGQRKYGHSHKQPQADAPATTDEWDENEPCVSASAPPVLNNVATPSSSSAISSASAVSSTADKASSTEEATPTSTQEAPKETPKEEEQPKPPKKKPEDKPAQEEPPKEVDNGGGKGVGSNGGQSGQATRYSVMNPAENHNLASGSVACWELGRFDDSDHIAAVPISQFNTGMCGKKVNVCGEGACLDVMIVDSCVGDGCRALDLTPGAFDVITGTNDGVKPITFKWL